MNNFFLLGLPRCRSVWLSYLLSYGDSYCYHELLSNKQMPFMNKLPTMQGINNVGSSDTYPMNFSESIVKDSPLVIIHRPLEDIKIALAKSHGYEPENDTECIVDRMQEKLHNIHSDNQININFCDLSDRKVVLKIMNHCGVFAHSAHVHKLMNTNITTSNDDINNTNHGAVHHQII